MKFKFHNRTVKRLEKSVQKATELNNFRLFKIAKSLLMVANDTSIADIASFLNLSERTIYNWISRFIVERFTWILGFHYKGRGRKSKLSENQKEKLYDIVVAGPENYGFDCGVWNSPMIAKVIGCGSFAFSI